jgi:hypothetical protein
VALTKSRDYFELGGFVAIIVSLLLLVYEIRQNTLAVQSTALQQHFAQHTELILGRLDNPALLTSIKNAQKGLDSLTDEDLALYGPYATNVIRNHFVAFELMRTGLLPKSQWRTFQAALGRGLRRSQGDREFWDLRRDEYPKEFQDMVDALVAESKIAEPKRIE